MNEKDNFDIDDELARSLERLVEEETNVAKAAYSDEEHVNNENINSESVRKASKSIDLDATQMVDRDMVKSLATGGSGALQNRQAYEKNEMPELSDDDLEDDEADLTEGIKDERSVLKKEKEAAPHGLTKRNKLIIAGVSGLVVLVVLIIVIVAVVINSNNKKSYEYNYDKGMEYYNSQDYNQAVDFLSKAFATSDGKKNVEMMCALADAYNRTGQTDKAIEVLKEALAYDKLNEKALTALAQLYQDNKNGAELTELIRDYKGTKSESVLDAYKVSAPTPSETPGNFDDAIELRLMAADGCDIYYTIDGSEPTEKSIKYSGSIKIEKDTVTVKAVAVNSIGVNSDVAEFTYTIALKAPEAPKLSPESSEVTVGTKIVIEGLADDEKAYYTLDGSTPSANSSQYSGGIELNKTGNYVVSVIVINKHNLSSTVTRCSYTVIEEKSYSQAEAEAILMKRLQENGKVSSLGTVIPGGGTAKLEYQSTMTISGVEMYYIRLDVYNGTSRTTDGYYGVGVKNGQCYTVTGSNGSLSAVQY